MLENYYKIRKEFVNLDKQCKQILLKVLLFSRHSNNRLCDVKGLNLSKSEIHYWVRLLPPKI